MCTIIRRGGAFFLLGMVFLAGGQPRAEDFETALARGIQGHWREADSTVWDIAPDLVLKTDRDGRPFRYVGFRLNASISPPWLDLLYRKDGQLMLALGIVHLRGDRLVWTEGEHVDAKQWAAAGGDLPGRPEGFQSSKERKQIAHILMRPTHNPRW